MDEFTLHLIEHTFAINSLWDTLIAALMFFIEVSLFFVGGYDLLVYQLIVVTTIGLAIEKFFYSNLTRYIESALEKKVKSHSTNNCSKILFF